MFTRTRELQSLRCGPVMGGGGEITFGNDWLRKMPCIYNTESQIRPLIVLTCIESQFLPLKYPTAHF